MKKAGVVILMLFLVLSSQAFAKKTKTKTEPKAVKEDVKAPEESVPAESGKVLHSFSRMISFDPHPTDINPLENSTVDFNGKKVSYKVQFIETWDTNGKAPNLKELGFKVVLTEDGKDIKTLDFPRKALADKAQKKGAILGTDKGDNLGVNIKVDEATKEGKNLTGLSITVNLLGYGEVDKPQPAKSEVKEPATPSASETAEGGDEEPAPAPVSVTAPKTEPASGIPLPSLGTTMKVALEIAKKADELESAKTAAKILLYKKALSALGTAVSAAENAAFVSEIQGKIAQLGGKTEPAVSANPADAKPADAKPAVSASPVSKVKADPEAQKMLDEAHKMLAMGKEPEARDLLRKAVEKDPNFHEAWFLLGKNAFGNSKYAKAKEALEKCLGLKDDDIEATVLYFKSCYYLGESETGLEKLRTLAKKFPEKYQARMALAEGFYQAGDFTSCDEECTNISAKFKMDDRLRDLIAKVKEKTK